MNELDKQVTVLGKRVHHELARISAPECDFNAWNAVLEMYANTPEMNPDDILDAAQTRGDRIVEAETTANIHTDLQGKHGEVRRYPDRIEAIYDAGQKFIVVPQIQSPVTTRQEVVTQTQSAEAVDVLKGFQVVAKNDDPAVAGEQQNAFSQFILGKKAA
jgi:hypothetical protein